MSLYATVVESKQFLHSIGICGKKKKILGHVGILY